MRITTKQDDPGGVVGFDSTVARAGLSAGTGSGRLDELIYSPPTTPRQWSRFQLGIALVLGGIRAALAGISYQASGYVLKCARRDLCVCVCSPMVLKSATASRRHCR